MAEKDVALVIKARNDASRAIDSVAEALKALTEIQEKVSKSASKTDDVMAQLGQELSNLNNEAKGLSALGAIATQLDKATQAVQRLEAEVTKTSSDLATLERDFQAAQQSTGKLTAEIERQVKALEAQNAATKAARDAQTLANRELRSAEGLLARLEKRMANAKKPAEGLQGRMAEQRAAVENLRTVQQSAVDNYNAQRRAQDEAAKSLRSLKSDLTESALNERKLTSAIASATDKLQAQNAGLAKAQTGLTEIGSAAGRASAVLGGVAVSQDSIAEASKRAAADIAKLNSVLEKQKTLGVIAGGATGVSSSQAPDRSVAAYKAQVAAVAQAKTAWKDAVAEANKLAAAIKATEQPTLDQQRAFLLAQAASKQAKTEYLAQGAALGQIRGVANSSYREFDQMARKAAQSSTAAAESSVKLAEASRKAASSQRDIAPAANSAGAGMRAAASGANGFRSALEGVYGESRKAMSLLQRIRGEVLSLAAGYIGLQAAIGQVGGVLGAYQNLEAVQNRLGAVFNQDTSKVGQELDFLRTQADRLGISFDTLADQYGKFAVAANEANFSNKATREIFLAVAEAARVNKLSVADTSGVFLALTQMISKGKVNAQELRQQMGERLPGAFNIFAKAIGVSTAQLDKMMESGQLLANQDTLLKFAQQLNDRFGPQLATSLESVTTQIGRLQNNIFNAQLDVANGGFIAGLNEGLKTLNEFFQSDDGKRFFDGIGAALGRFTVVLAQVPKYFDEILVGVQAFVAVKLGSVLTDLVSRFTAVAATAGKFSQELQFVGPRMQQMSLAQRTLGQGFAQTIGAIDRFRVALATSTSTTTLARAGVLGLNATLGVVRTTMIGVATVARGLWAAIGGLPGLVLTGVTFALGSWLTSIDTATSALDTHRAMLEKVKKGYDDAGGSADTWSKKVNGVTLAQASKNAEDVRKEFEKAFQNLQGVAQTLYASFAAFDGTPLAQMEQIKALQDFVEKARTGKITLAELSTALNDIALNAKNADIKQYALDMLDLINVAKDGKPNLLDLADATQKAEALVRVMAGTATEADEALLNMGDAAKTAGDGLDKGVFSIDAYNAALDKLKEKVPALAEAMKRLKDSAEIDSAGLQAFAEAIKSGDVAKIAEAMNLYAQARQAIQDVTDSKLYDSLPNQKNVVDRIIYVEGGQNGSGPSTSTARGIGQMTEATWLGLFNKVFPELSQLNDNQKLALRSQEEVGRKMVEALTKQNQLALVRAGLDANPANTYLAHFLGAGDAIKVLVANPEELVSNIVGPKSIAANPNVFTPGMTAADLVKWADTKMGGGSTIMAGGETKQEQFDQTIRQRIEGWQEEAAARSESNKQGEIAKALHQAEVEAAKAGTVLTKEQADAIRAATAARYDALHAGEEERKQRQEEQEAVQSLIGLDQQRKVALKELQDAMAEGDQGRVEELRQQIADLNAEITALLPKALALAQALGDEKGVASLKKITLNAKELNVELTNAKQINNMLADGLTNAFSTAAQGIGQAIVGAKSWGDALLGVRNAFLQFAADFLIQIGQMILKQMLLNMLSQAFGGMTGGIGGAIAGAVNALVKHDGGMVMAGAGMSRAVPAGLFANAVRYHSGGVAGLRPNEVPAILEVGERVRTKEQEAALQKDLRSGSSGSSSGSRAPSIRNIIAFDEKQLASAMANSAGEEVVLNFVKRNAQTIKRMLK